jgi:hypothetical protein
MITHCNKGPFAARAVKEKRLRRRLWQKCSNLRMHEVLLARTFFFVGGNAKSKP